MKAAIPVEALGWTSGGEVQASVPAPLIALLGATLIYIAWQLPYLGAVAVIAALAYALGAVVTARLAHSADTQLAAR